MIFVLKLIVIGGMWISTISLSDQIGVNPRLASYMVLIGGISFFLGPYATGSGFFVKGGFYVNSATPEWIWKLFGVILWIIAIITIFYEWMHPGI